MSAVRLSLSLLLGALLAPLSLTATAQAIGYAGCHTMTDWFMEPLLKAYSQQKGVEYTLDRISEDMSISAVSNGNLTIAGACRLPKTQGQERDTVVIESERNVIVIPVAWEPLTVVVHGNNPLGDVSLAQLREIVSGSKTSWADFGWPEGGEIKLYLGDAATSADTNLRTQLFEGAEQVITESAIRVPDEHEAIKAIEQEANGIGIVPYSDAMQSTLKRTLVEGTSTLPGALRNGKYPLYQLLSIVVPRDYKEQPHIKELVDFILSREGQSYLDRSNVLPYIYGLSILSHQGYQASLSMNAVEQAGIYHPGGL